MQSTQITTRNARELRDSLRNELLHPIKASREAEGQGSAEEHVSDQEVDRYVEDEATDQVQTVGEGTEAGEDHHQETIADGTQEQNAEKNSPQSELLSRISELESKLAKAERQFKAIQSAVTPTQQENARLRKEVSILREQLASKAPKSSPEDRARQLEELRNILPEGAPLIEELLAKTKQHEDEIERSARVDYETRKETAMTSIFRAHSDAQEIAKNPAFWQWVESHGPASEFMKATLERPWDYDYNDVIRYFNEFKEEIGQMAQPPATVATPDVATPTQVRRPTAVAAPVRTGASQVQPGHSGTSRVWSDREWAAKRAELNSNKTSPQRIRALREEMRAQLLMK